MFQKGKTCIIAKLHRTDVVICSHSREGKTLSFSQINMVRDHYGGEKLSCNQTNMVYEEKAYQTTFYKNGQTHGAPFCGYGYVQLRNGGNVVRRMGTQQLPSIKQCQK